jgi:DnaK suppressor protein
MLSAADLKAFRTQLLVLANKAEDVRSDLASETDRDTVTASDAASDLLHPAEIHSRAAEEVVTTQLLGIETEVQREALAAIERIDAGTFGVCAKCGKPIPKARLEALPYTRVCVKCAS